VPEIETAGTEHGALMDEHFEHRTDDEALLFRQDPKDAIGRTDALEELRSSFRTGAVERAEHAAKDPDHAIAERTGVETTLTGHPDCGRRLVVLIDFGVLVGEEDLVGSDVGRLVENEVLDDGLVREDGDRGIGDGRRLRGFPTPVRWVSHKASCC